MAHLRFLLVIWPRWGRCPSVILGILVWPDMTMLTRLLAFLPHSLTSSPRSHHSILLLTTLCQSVVAAELVGLLVVWCWSPWAWLGGGQVASVAISSAELHLYRSRLVSPLERRESIGQGVVLCDLRFGSDRLEPAAGGGVLWWTCWVVDSRLGRWCRAASTAMPLTWGA
jgi:hypothetical protein